MGLCALLSLGRLFLGGFLSVNVTYLGWARCGRVFMDNRREGGSPSLFTTTKAAPRSSSFVVFWPFATQASRILSSFSILRSRLRCR